MKTMRESLVELASVDGAEGGTEWRDRLEKWLETSLPESLDAWDVDVVSFDHQKHEKRG